MTIYHRTEYPEQMPSADFDRYLALGWYRMRQHVFTCSHLFDFNENSELSGLRRVWWMRFSINDILQHASHLKLKKRNNGFRVVMGPHSTISAAEENLYCTYRASIDFDGYPTLQDALFDRTADATIYNSQSISVYDGEKLIAFGILDLGEKSASSQIHCYDPAYASYSLGKYLILLTLDHLKSLGHDWYYPGYVFAGNPKMNYKLFAGKEAAEYFDPETGEWQAFVEELLDDEPYSEEIIVQVSEKMFGRTKE